MSFVAKVWYLPTLPFYTSGSLSLILLSQMFTNVFTKFLFGGSRGTSLSTDRNVGRDKAAYIWISPDPAKAGPTLGVIVAVIVVAAWH